MMLKTMIILLASDDEGITLKLHSHGRLSAKLVARNLQWWGGLSHKNQTKTVYSWNWNGFLPEITEYQKNDVRPHWDRVLRPNSLQVQGQSSHILFANDNGRAIFAFRVKAGLKSIKNRVFCILCMPMGGQPPPPPPPPDAPGHATTFSCENRHFVF